MRQKSLGGDLAGSPGSVRVLATAALDAARRVLDSPALYSVLVDLRETALARQPIRLRFGFQEVRRRLMRGDIVRVCWVDIDLDPPSIATGEVGTFGRRQLQKLASIPGLDFPPHRLDLDALRLEPIDVLRLLEDRPSGIGPSLGNVELSLFRHGGRLAWRVLQDVGAAGFRTLYVDAGTGEVLLEKVDSGAAES